VSSSFSQFNINKDRGKNRRNVVRKYKAKKEYHNVQYKYENTIIVEAPTKETNKNFKNLTIANLQDLEKSDLTKKDIIAYMKIVYFILFNLNDDFYYDTTKDIYVSKINKMNEIKFYLQKNKEVYDKKYCRKFAQQFI